MRVYCEHELSIYCRFNLPYVVLVMDASLRNAMQMLALLFEKMRCVRSVCVCVFLYAHECARRRINFLNSFLIFPRLAVRSDAFERALVETAARKRLHSLLDCQRYVSVTEC